MQKLRQESSFSALEFESYQLGKHQQASYPNCVNDKSNSPFNLVDSDDWGSCRVTSILGLGIFYYLWMITLEYLECIC